MVIVRKKEKKEKKKKEKKNRRVFPHRCEKLRRLFRQIGKCLREIEPMEKRPVNWFIMNIWTGMTINLLDNIMGKGRRNAGVAMRAPWQWFHVGFDGFCFAYFHDEKNPSLSPSPLHRNEMKIPFRFENRWWKKWKKKKERKKRDKIKIGHGLFLFPFFLYFWSKSILRVASKIIDFSKFIRTKLYAISDH